MRIAILGLGRMGAAIARRLEPGASELFVWNRSPGPADEFVARGAALLASPAEALARAELCITTLADPAAVEEVSAAVLGGAETGTTLMDMSTISVESSARVAAAAETRGVVFLRAPVSGNAVVVAAGNLGIIVSGSRDRFDELTPTLLEIGANLFYVGEGEQSRVVKLALNLVIGGTAELLAEALVLAEANGIERRDMLAVMGGSAVGSPFVKYKTEPLIADDYTPTFTATLLEKDLALGLKCAADSGVPLPVSTLTHALVQECIALGMGESDLMALLPRLRREAGLE